NGGSHARDSTATPNCHASSTTAALSKSLSPPLWEPRHFQFLCNSALRSALAIIGREFSAGPDFLTPAIRAGKEMPCLVAASPRVPLAAEFTGSNLLSRVK